MAEDTIEVLQKTANLTFRRMDNPWLFDLAMGMLPLLARNANFSPALVDEEGSAPIFSELRFGRK